MAVDWSSLAEWSAGGVGATVEPMFDIDLREVNHIPRLMEYLEKHGGNPEKPLKRFNVYMMGQVDKTFQKGGRGAVQWRPLAEVTKIMRAYRKRGRGRTGPQKILQDTGHLKNATRSEIVRHGESLGSRIFNDVPYGPTHQFGGEIKIPARTIRAKKAKALHFFTKSGEEVFCKKVHQPAKTKAVPARPFLFFLEEDERKAVELFLDHAREISGRVSGEQRA